MPDEIGVDLSDAVRLGPDISLFFFSSRRRHTRLQGDWSSDVCSSDLVDVFGDHFCRCRVTFIAEDDGDRPVYWRRDSLKPYSCGAETIREVEAIRQAFKSQVLAVSHPPGILDGDRGVTND